MNGYITIDAPGHPHSGKDGKIQKHVSVIEKHLGKIINPKYWDVHHKDGNIKNNKYKNLLLLTKKQHRRLHSGWRLINKIWYKTCGRCKKEMAVSGNFYKRSSGSSYTNFCKKCILDIPKHNIKYVKCKLCNNKLRYKYKYTKYLCRSCSIRISWIKRKDR